MAYFSIANCFTSDLLESTPKIQSSGCVKVGTGFVCPPNSRIISANWNSDGALVISDADGNTHYYLGYNKHFTAYKGETQPHDIKGYRETVEQNKKLREAEKYEKEAKKERSEKKSGNTNWGCCILKWTYKIFMGWLCLCINLEDSKN